MKTKPFDEEQLSIILGEHDAGQLVQMGAFGWLPSSDETRQGHKAPVGCINQVAYNECEDGAAFLMNKDVARWFDRNYGKSDSIEYLLLRMEELSFARLP